MLSLRLLGGQSKAEPRHDAWPPTWQLPSGAIRVDASFKEPGRQKLISKATKAVAFLGLVAIVLGQEHWFWPELIYIDLNVAAGSDESPISERAAAWLLVVLTCVGTFVGTFRLLLAALGIDQGRILLQFNKDLLLINGRSFEQKAVRGFELEPHLLGKFEGHSERQLGQTTSLYYRNAYTINLCYAERRIEIAHVLGLQPATRLLMRLQELHARRSNMKSIRG
ncbi:MAG: hypothetical protein AAF483_09990 [Planctomycetota bacterium]